MAQTLLPEIVGQAELVIPASAVFDLDKIMSIAMIRTHIKADDTPRVTDDQLRLYRSASIEAAEAYTGLLIGRQRQQIETIEARQSLKALRQGWFWHRTEYPIADGIAYLYGNHRGAGSRTLHVEKGATKIKVPTDVAGVDLTSSCCNPCASGSDQFLMRVMYLAGFACETDIPAGIILGCLKFIAWSVANPGDELVTMRDTAQGNSVSGVAGTNNAIWASGALDQWRVYVKDVT